MRPCLLGAVGLVVMVVLAVVVVVGLLPGCVSYKSDTPLVTLDGTGYGGRSRPEPGNIPAGDVHSGCRDELAKAIRRIESLEKDLADCKADRKKDKDNWEAEKKRLERDRDLYKDERDAYKKRLDNLLKRD